MISFEEHPFYKRFLVLFKDFKSTFSKDIQMDVETLPDCNKLDSLERWYEIYETAYLNFTDQLSAEDKRFDEQYQSMVGYYGEGVIYPTKRKLEYIAQLIEEEKSNKIVAGGNNKPWESIKNNFDGIEISEVYEYFRLKLVKNEHLTEQELLLYLKAAFEERNITKRFMLRNPPSKGKIVNIFYEYYKKASKPFGKQREYAELLGEYFEGYNTSNVSSNFSKSYFSR